MPRLKQKTHPRDGFSFILVQMPPGRIELPTRGFSDNPTRLNSRAWAFLNVYQASNCVKCSFPEVHGGSWEMCGIE